MKKTFEIEVPDGYDLNALSVQKAFDAAGYMYTDITEVTPSEPKYVWIKQNLGLPTGGECCITYIEPTWGKGCCEWLVDGGWTSLCKEAVRCFLKLEVPNEGDCVKFNLTTWKVVEVLTPPQDPQDPEDLLREASESINELLSVHTQMLSNGEWTVKTRPHINVYNKIDVYLKEKRGDD